MAKKIKPKWCLCQYCIDALRSRGEKVYVGEQISQDIDSDEEGNWFQIYDETEPIRKCDFCEEVDPTLYECM